jgi:hypothetical protein
MLDLNWNAIFELECMNLNVRFELKCIYLNKNDNVVEYE